MIKFLRKYYDVAYLYTTDMVNTDISRIPNCTKISRIHFLIFDVKILSYKFVVSFIFY